MPTQRSFRFIYLMTITLLLTDIPVCAMDKKPARQGVAASSQDKPKVTLEEIAALAQHLGLTLSPEQASEIAQCPDPTIREGRLSTQWYMVQTEDPTPKTLAKQLAANFLATMECPDTDGVHDVHTHGENPIDPAVEGIQSAPGHIEPQIIYEPVSLETGLRVIYYLLKASQKNSKGGIDALSNP